MDTMPIYSANGLIIYSTQDFEYWVGEQVKRIATGPHQTMKTTEWSIEHNVLLHVERIEEICKAVREECLVIAIDRQCEQIRHLREDNDGFSEFETKQRQYQANELEDGKLKELEAALAEALAMSS